MVDMIASQDTAIILHNVFVFLLPPYPVFGALYYIDRVSTAIDLGYRRHFHFSFFKVFNFKSVTFSCFRMLAYSFEPFYALVLSSMLSNNFPPSPNPTPYSISLF